MHVVATADFHGTFPEIPECDLLLVAGDVCPIKDDHAVWRQREWLRKVYGPWLGEQPAKHIVWIAGNHDFACEAPWFRREVADDLPGTYLEDDVVEIEGLRIFGSPWVPNLRTWAFYHTDEQFKRDSEHFPECDLALLHGPPFSVLDFIEGHGSVGAPHVLKAIKKSGAKRVVFGHIHENYGKTVRDYENGPIHFNNVAHMDENYNPINPPIEFDI